MLTKIKNVLMKFDLFGHLLTFEEDNSPIFKTSIGSLFSYLIIIFIIIIGYIFGQEIYLRQTPNLVSGKEIVGRNDSAVNLKDFPFIITTIDTKGGSLGFDYRSLFNIEIYHVNTDARGSLTYTIYYGFSECKVENYSERFQPYVKTLLQYNKINNWDSYCFIHKGQEDSSIGNKYLTPDSDFILVSIADCNEQERNMFPYVNKDSEILTNAPDCLENRKDLLQDFIVKFNYINSVYNFKDYKNPDIHYADSFARHIGYGMMYSLILEIGIERLISDNGWLLESKELNEVIYLDSITTLPFLMNGINKDLLSINIITSNQIKMNYRSYMKVQELFAKIGGIFNAFFILIKLILYDYIRFKFKVNYSEYTIDATELEKNKDLYPEIDNYKRSFLNMIKNSNSKLKTNKKLEIISKEADSINNESKININTINKREISLTPLNYKDIKSNVPINTKSLIPTNNFINSKIIRNSNNNNSSVDMNSNNEMNKNNTKDNNNICQNNISISYNNNNNNKDGNDEQKFIKTNTFQIFKFEEDFNSKTLNDYLIEKVRKSNYFKYILVLICGCCYKNKPVSYQIVNSNYFRIRYSFKYFLQENKKFSCFKKSMHLSNLNNINTK